MLADSINEPIDFTYPGPRALKHATAGVTPVRGNTFFGGRRADPMRLAPSVERRAAIRQLAEQSPQRGLPMPGVSHGSTTHRRRH
jgi:hypothetical protein